MSGDNPLLALQPDDVTKILSAAAHIGAQQCSAQMVPYVYKCRADGVNILKLDRMWEKLLLAARAVAAVEHPQDIFAVSTRPFGQRAVLKFAHFTGATPIAGRFTPGTFTNQAQKGYREPRLLIITDPLTDHQAVYESAYANVPVIAFCNTDARLKYVDIAVPCNNKAVFGIGLMWWLLTREVLRLRGRLSRAEVWSIVPDLFFYRDPEELAKESDEPEPVDDERQSTGPATTATSVADITRLTEAVQLGDSTSAVEPAAGESVDQQWPNAFRLDDWNEDVDATKATATWGAPNAIF